jgi:histidinol dehydrogenase
MVMRLKSAAAGFGEDFRRVLEQKRETAAEVNDAVAAILAEVRMRGDAALVQYTAMFDGLEIGPDDLAIGTDEIDAAVEHIDRTTLDALTLARDRIRDHHRRQLPRDERYEDGLGVELGHRWTAVDSVGLYVPGGKANYPSSVLMNAVPAAVAGVRRIAMVVPAPGGTINPLVLAAARLAGIDEIYRIGGAQAVGALAFGTETIRPVAKIVGPGNAYVAAAKRQVFGQVGIDMIAGPSEVLVVADGANDPAWIAADLLAQAEHDENAQSILITDSSEFAEAVAAAVETQMATLPRADTAAASWRDYGAIIVVPDLSQAAPLVDAIAPEHLQIATEDPDAFFSSIRNAGAVFLGRHTPEAIGDYVAGTNHVLPTARTARYASGLSVLDFVKRTSILRLGPEQLAELGPSAVTLAKAEGLDAHGRSVAIRMNR